MRKRFPSIVSQVPNDLRQFLERVREAFAGQDRVVTAGDLVDLGVAKTTPQGDLIPAAPAQTCFTPPAPTNVSASGALANILVEWDDPVYPCHAYAEVWAAEVDDVGQAVQVGMAPGGIFVHNTGGAAVRYYWVRFVSTEDQTGAFNATAGVRGETGQDPGYLISVLSDEYGSTSKAPFFQIDEPTTINGVLIPAGTYMKAAFIADGTITNAKIANLAVDNAKIASLSASKIQAGSIGVGEYIRSSSYVAGSQGWAINGSGTAEFGAASIRGLLTADQIDTRNLTVKDASGNVILGSGTKLSSSWINSVTSSQVTGLGTLATQNSVNWNTQITNVPAFGNFAYLSTITSANISTYIQGAAIGTAYIANAAITEALVANAAITNAKIANLDAAKITTGTLSADRIAANTISADRIVANAIASATTYTIEGWLSGSSGVLAYGSTLTTGNTALVSAFTFSNSSTRSSKILVIGQGRSGVISDSSGFQAFSVFTSSGSPVFSYGWTPVSSDDKGFGFTHIVPANSSETFYVRAAKSSPTSSFGYVFTVAILGVNN